jgi:regulator of sigma E protease
MGINIIAFVIVLGVLIFFHELGHFMVARLFGVGVEKFSLGFGPRLFGKTIGDTDYRISVFPLGGYVKMVGEEPGGEIDPADIPRSFTHKKIYKKMLIVAAGPMFNFVLAMIIFFFLTLTTGVFELDTRAVFGDVSEDGVAAAHGLQKGDRVVSIDGAAVETWDEMSAIITGSEGRTLQFVIDRNGDFLDVALTPALTDTMNAFGEESQRYIIGVGIGGDYRSAGIGEAAIESVRDTYFWAELTVVSLWKLIEGSMSRDNLGGPIRIAQVAGEQFKAGTDYFVFFIAILSVNLAIINFIPVPVLDGGHLLFFAIEAVIRRPLNTRMREVAQQIGIFILVSLMIYVFYNDITQLIRS